MVNNNRVYTYFFFLCFYLFMNIENKKETNIRVGIVTHNNVQVMVKLVISWLGIGTNNENYGDDDGNLRIIKVIIVFSSAR